MGRARSLRYAATAVRPARRAILAIALAGLGLTVASCQSVTPYAAIVNGTPISQSELLRELHALNSNATFVSDYDASIAQGSTTGAATRLPVLTTDTAAPVYSQSFASVVLSTDIQAAVIAAEVQRRHLEPNAATVAAAKTEAAGQFGSDPTVFGQFPTWFQTLFQERTAQEDALRKAIGTVPSDPAAVDAFYNANQSDFITTECVSHILVNTLEQAASIRAQIMAGADFATMAKKYSIDSGSAVKGGVLGCQAPGQYVAPFEEVADSIPVGQLSEPVHSQFGWHLIEVTSRQLTPLDAATVTEIQQHLQQEDPVSAFLTVAAKTLVVKINPTYGTWDPTSFTVDPPTTPAANSGAPTTTTPPASSNGSSSGETPATDANGNPVTTAPPATDANGNPVPTTTP